MFKVANYQFLSTAKISLPRHVSSSITKLNVSFLFTFIKTSLSYHDPENSF